MNVQKAMRLRTAPLQTPTDLKAEGVREISGALNVLLADVFALYLKTKNFHWHISGPHFRDYHLLLDEHGDQIFAMTDPIAERVRKIGGMTLRSIGEISRHQRIQDNDAEFVIPLDMLAELRDDNKELVAKMRETHGLCDEHNDVATASLLEVWIDEAERRTWFLFEATRAAEFGSRISVPKSTLNSCGFGSWIELTVHVSSSRRCPSSATPMQLINVGPAKGLGKKQIAPACKARARVVSSGKAVMNMNGAP